MEQQQSTKTIEQQIIMKVNETVIANLLLEALYRKARNWEEANSPTIRIAEKSLKNTLIELRQLSPIAFRRVLNNTCAADWKEFNS